MLNAIWPSRMPTGTAALDMLHREFLHALACLACESEKKFEQRYRAFVQTAEYVFSTEEQWMEMIDCPALKHHREQHARVLGALHHVHLRVMCGDLETGRDVAVRLLPQWFTFHAATMDTALGMELQSANADLALIMPEQYIPYAEHM